jgi:hypothetical protein
MTWARTVLQRKYYVPKHLESEEYLQRILPPLPDSCEVCGKHTSKLKPFGGRGDPLLDEFRGEFLIITWRPAGPYDEEAQSAWEEAEKAIANTHGSNDLLRWFTAKYGKQKGKKLYDKGLAYRSLSPSSECRDCIVLDEDDYFEKLAQRDQERQQVIPDESSKTRKEVLT